MQSTTVMQDRNNAKPSLSLIIYNISKYNNIRALFQVGLAFGCQTIYVVGQRTFDTSLQAKDLPLPVKEAVEAGRLTIVRFEKYKACLDHLRSNNIRLLGVEIHEDAKLVQDWYSEQDTALIMGNEGQGLSLAQMRDCDGLVRIPQYGGGTASLNVYVAASIVLQDYHAWLRTRETSGGDVL
jgi:tRNA G18 (ribose-2'-O)-methylase SpoU